MLNSIYSSPASRARQVRPVPRQEVRLQVDPPRVQRAAAVVEHDDGLAVAKRGEVPRMEQRLAALAERLARPDAAGAAPGRAGGEPLPGPRRRRRRSVLRSGRCMGTAVVFAERGAVVYNGGVASWWSGLSRTSMKPVVYGGCAGRRRRSFTSVIIVHTLFASAPADRFVSDPRRTAGSRAGSATAVRRREA